MIGRSTRLYVNDYSLAVSARGSFVLCSNSSIPGTCSLNSKVVFVWGFEVAKSKDQTLFSKSKAQTVCLSTNQIQNMSLLLHVASTQANQ